ncbi:MBOAT family O-acyltransferase [Lignipirellula cremea]|uniref:Peptidoglycan O-acetyltransferase n=1 Tax=Lignipirellula cremea TaxID=2528010 RepID=A0A518E0R1_9BACT|nr:MBOAT family O-acyltransferase [Lignipirellula cremea]QDU97670.1 Peptidoglycan O-acetyltransferase [Lignipirellula cremea]
MNFASWSFVGLFLPAVLLAVYSVRGSRTRQWVLIVSSIAFYGLSGFENLIVLIFSLLANYAIGASLVNDAETRRLPRKLLLWGTIAANIACLLAFKWMAVVTAVGTGFRTASDILVPLALAFVTLQQIGFIVACEQGRIRQVKFADYAFFLFFFPQLIMGPIVRFRDIQRQLCEGSLAQLTTENLAIGLSIFCFGLAKKTLLADHLLIPVERIFAAAEWVHVPAIDAWFAVVGFQLQLFLDFSAYADMAIGLARIFGIDLPLNFDRPFEARDRFDLWRRWHISYVSFIRTHVFLPLVLRARAPVVVALALTGLISGVWHGLGWTFLLWGLLQAIILLVVHYRRKLFGYNASPSRFRVFTGVAATFFITCMIGLCFRSGSLEATVRMLQSLFSFQDNWSLISWRSWLILCACAFAVWGWPATQIFFRKYWTALDLRPAGNRPSQTDHPWAQFELSGKWAIVMGILFACSLLFLDQSQRFIYEQF